MNFLPTASRSLNVSIKIWGVSISQEWIGTLAQRAMGLVAQLEDSVEVGREPLEKEKGSWRVNRKVESEVETACPTVISALRVELTPGSTAERSLRMLTASRLVLGLLLMTAPMFGFSSQMSPEVERAYISMLGEIFWMLGITLIRWSSRAYSVFCSRLLSSLTATIFVGLRMELNLVNCAVVMARVKVGLLKLVHWMGTLVLTNWQ